MKILLALTALVTLMGCSRQETPVSNTKNSSDAGKGLRMLALSTPASRFGFTPNEEYPRVFGVLTDWNIGDHTASILATRGGTASLYTTSTFGIIGGEGHEAVRIAAEKCAIIADRFYEISRPVTEFPYPNQESVYFYLLTYDGVRLFEGNMEEIDRGTDQALPLFAAAQDVLTELRLVTEK